MTSKICVVIPAYNASKTIQTVVSGALKYIPRVMVVDDGSADDTAGNAILAGAEVIVVEKNRGKGHALKLLFQKAMREGYDAVISMDADGQHDPAEIPKFLASHIIYPDDIIIGSRMSEKEKIPKARFNSMRIARFYISLAANQYLEDTQCGFRLYPLSLIKKMRLMTERYVTETELLMKAGDMGMKIRFIDIKAIYTENKSYYRPVTDTMRITSYVISYIHIKWFIEGITSDNPNTYSVNGHVRDILGKNKIIDRAFQTLTVFTALPATIFYLFEYAVLSLFIPHNFASVRKYGCGFFKITLATQMLPVLLIVAIIEKMLKIMGFKRNIINAFIEMFFPNLWADKG